MTTPDEPAAAPAEPVVSGPPLPVRVVLVAALLLSILPLGYAVQYTRDWAERRMGKSYERQRLSYAGVSWFQPEFQNFVTWLKLAMAEQENPSLLLTPKAKTLESGRARWYLYLAFYIYPVPVYVRRSNLASGTLVEYPEWLKHHFELLNLDSDHFQTLGELVERQRVNDEELADVARRRVKFELVYSVDRDFRLEELEFYRLRYKRGADKPERVPIEIPVGRLRR